LSEHKPLPQDAFRSKPVSDEDKYYAQREAEILEDLRAARAARSEAERRCPCPECEGAVLDRVQHDQVEIDVCPKCKGTWLDAGEMDLLTGRAKGSPNALTKFFRNLTGDYSV
jgi:Zn-finger nucleic acid-binding protein